MKKSAPTKKLICAFYLDDVVIGGGNAKKLIELPKGCRAGDNANAFLGGFRLWEDRAAARPRQRKTKPPRTLRPRTVPAPAPSSANPL